MTIRPTQFTRRHTLLAACVIAAFVAILYAALLFTNRVLASGDILLYFTPYRAYASEALRSGRIPFWNPYIFMGAPFLANPQAAVFYPLHLPLLWLSATAQIYWSAALHTWLLGFGGYLLVRRMEGGWLAGVVTGITLAGSGFYGGMIGHLNQMNVAAWLPWLLLFVTPVQSTISTLHDKSNNRGGIARILLATAAFGIVVAMMLLAGHTQTAYINLFGVGLWTVALAVRTFWLRRTQPDLALERWYAPLAVYTFGVLLGALIAAPQLLPTLELSQLGIRSGGLSFFDATSFSLKPLSLHWTLLPTYGLAPYQALFETAAWSEFIAWIGLVGLALAAVGALKGRGLVRWLGLGFAVLGLALALGRWNPAYWLLHQFVPGFDLFRTPARWMMLYTLGVAVLAGMGAQWLVAWTQQRSPNGRRLSRLVQVGLPLLLAVELLLAARALPQSDPTAPEAVFGLRTAPAHLATDAERLAAEVRGDDPAVAGRYLGMSTITYDPGDMSDSERIYRDAENPQLSENAFNDLIIAQKVQELLVPNLPMFWRIPAVDGYDGGTLPLQRYNALVALLAPGTVLAPDGRLREQIVNVPSATLLKTLGVRYIIADKVRDLWFDNVYYDRQIGMTLTAENPNGTISVPSPFEATHLDLIAALKTDANALATLSESSTPIAQVTIEHSDGVITLPINAGGAAGAQVADDALDSPLATTSGATVAFRDLDAGMQEYRVRLPLESPITPTRIRIELVPFVTPAASEGIALRVQAATLYDERSGMFTPLLPSDRGDFALVHSGDVKIYENQSGSARAWLAYTTHVASSLEAEREMLVELIAENPALPAAVVADGGPQLAAPANHDASADTVEITSYQPERVEVRTRSAVDTLLGVADANYPGWSATVDGIATPIHTTNLLFRGVPVPAGEHTVIFTFTPTNWTLAVALAAVGIMIALTLIIVGTVLRRDAYSVAWWRKP